MGQEQSAESKELTPEQLSLELAHRFANKCFTPLEIYCFKEVFKSLCDEQSGVRYWTEDSLCKFLEIPDALEVGSVLYSMVTFLGAFPFPSQAPCIVTRENLLKVVTLMTARYERVLVKKQDRLKLFYGSLSAMDRRASEALQGKPDPAKKPRSEDPLQEVMKKVEGFAVDEPVNDDYDEAEEDDDLALAVLESMDATSVVGLTDAANVCHSIIPTDNFFKLLQLLLLIAPLDPQENLAIFADRISSKTLPDLRKTAECILSAFGVEDMPGITWKTFRHIVTSALPFVFEGFNASFEHFLFEKEFNLSKKRPSSTSSNKPTPTSPKSPVLTKSTPTPLHPDGGELLTTNTTCQLAFFLNPSTIFWHLHTLYRGASDGFSMGSFEQSVFTWHGPTILLISGTLLPDEPSNSRERTFAESLPPKRFPSSSKTKSVTYGAYIPTPWQTTHREPFGSAETLLFQLAPTHDVFHASEVSTDYTTFATAPHAHHPGIGFGCALGVPSPGLHTPVPLGAVSLFVDSALEYAVFTHTAPPSGASFVSDAARAAGGRRRTTGTSGGSFLPSSSPRRARTDWQDRFEIEALEVYGIGGAKEEAKRRRELEFEEREARLRREGKNALGVSGYEADKEILRMAGLIGHGEGGGGSMGGFGS